ncbi:glycoside hydrolase family 3 N-terminal domain-containing protein [Bifidobacterium mongoliense]|uniref:glycoside hydrolase family 3 N-terminal domain-containing protein n=1 Tax=Bifidobacterium mongoliense TaxID=518643 RepID=UPI0039C86624
MLVAALALMIPVLTGCGGAQPTASPSTPTSPTLATSPLLRSPAPRIDDSPTAQATRVARSMSLQELVGQLVMAPLPTGYDPANLKDEIEQDHVGSVLVTGNWNGGAAAVGTATKALQGYAGDGPKLITATDQEGGMVQHLQGPGFDPIPSGVQQGARSVDDLRAAAATWGGQLAAAGINVNLAPVVDTVAVNRASNAPIGALDRDFGLDAQGNGAHAQAFVNGMRDAGVSSAIKHYPGLGGVTGNTDFTADGITDATTTLQSPSLGAFSTALEAHPAMVMMSLATYTAVDPHHPAAFSSTLIDGHLRGDQGFQGVVISDSLSAAAVSGIPQDQLGVSLIEAGGDLACISAPSVVRPVLDGLNAKAATDPGFAAKVTRSAIRVLALKYQMHLAGAPAARP